MPIAISCPHCDWKGRVPDTLAGKKGKCPTCGELVPIPRRSGPPPVPGRNAVDDEPDVIDDADIVDDADVVEDRPRPKRPAARRRDDEVDDRPARSRRRDDDDDRSPRSRRRPADDDDEDDRPSRRRDDDEDDYRPRKSKRLADDEVEDRPRRRRVDDDEDDRPRRARGGPARRGRGRTVSSKKVGQIVASLFFLLLGLGLVTLYFLSDNPNKRPPIWGGLLIISSLLGIGQAAANPYEDD